MADAIDSRSPYRLTGRILVQLAPDASRVGRVHGFAAMPLARGSTPTRWRILEPWNVGSREVMGMLGVGPEPIGAFATPGGVAWVEPEVDYEVPVPPDGWETCGRSVEDDWHLEQINAQAAWNVVGNPGQGVLIAHLDTGIVGDVVRPLFKPDRMRLVSPAWDLVRNRAGAEDPLENGVLKQPGHGTGTATLLGADGAVPWGGGSRQYRGVSWSAKVLPLRIGKSVVHLMSQRMAAGIEMAVQAGADVVTISMGGLPSQRWADAVNFAYDHGVVVVAAAGNHFLWGPVRTPTGVVYPAAFERVIAVAGVKQDGGRYRFNTSGTMSGNDGPELDICAPTPCVPWMEPTNILEPGAGTSASTPQVAAAAAIWLAHHTAQLPAKGSPQAWRRVEAVRHALRVSANSRACINYRQDWFGSGRLDIVAAVNIPPNLDLPPKPVADVRGQVAHMVGKAVVDLVAETMIEGVRRLWNWFVGQRQ